MTEITNKPPDARLGNANYSNEEFGDLIIGCDTGTLIVFDVKRKPQSIVVIGSIHVHESKQRNPETLIEKKILMLPAREEPITNSLEV